MRHVKPVVLLILDGFGHRLEGDDNAILLAKTPQLDALKRQYAYGTIDASGRHVGLPAGQFGNSEVGHLNIGAGRMVPQDITRIDIACEEKTFTQNQTFKSLVQALKTSGGKLHLLGLLSDGGVHSHINHFFALMDAALESGVSSIVVHPFLDGRDTPPKSALQYLLALQNYQDSHPEVIAGSLSGRYFAMDRDKRWERVSLAYHALVGTSKSRAASAKAAVEAAYASGKSDEFIEPVVLEQNGVILDGDAVIFVNFRADRAGELTQALCDKNFDGFTREKVPQLSAFLSMTSYGEHFTHPVLFEPEVIKNSLGEYLAVQGFSQLRIAETEKYPHVTYFFNGGEEKPYPNEARILVSSPKVTTYDLQPEMSAREVTQYIVESLHNTRHDVIICNFANGDMVGHTGSLSAAIQAVEVLDECVGAIVKAAQQVGGEVLLTADHGNCERMFDSENAQVHTRHTMEPVPFLYVGRPANIKPGGALKDIAPSLLAMIGLPAPAEMQGQSLIEFL